MDERPAVSVTTAQHVLWHFGDTNLGVQPGGFWTLMFRAWDHADSGNRERAHVGWPEEAAAFFAVKFEPWGLEWLRSKVKRELVPDREHAPLNLFEAAAESPLYERVEADYWAAHPEAVPSDIQKGERVQKKGAAVGGTVVDVRDHGRVVQVDWDDNRPGLTQNLFASEVVRQGARS